MIHKIKFIYMGWIHWSVVVGEPSVVRSYCVTTRWGKAVQKHIYIICICSFTLQKESNSLMNLLQDKERLSVWVSRPYTSKEAKIITVDPWPLWWTSANTLARARPLTCRHFLVLPRRHGTRCWPTGLMEIQVSHQVLQKNPAGVVRLKVFSARIHLSYTRGKTSGVFAWQHLPAPFPEP